MKKVFKFGIETLAISAIGFLTFYALSQGIDGAVFMSGIGIIGGIAGYQIHEKVKK